MLVERLMRQCQQERRIATQLMQIRREKDTIRNNRIFRQQQLEEARLREFQEALDREAVCLYCIAGSLRMQLFCVFTPKKKIFFRVSKNF